MVVMVTRNGHRMVRVVLHVVWGRVEEREYADLGSTALAQRLRPGLVSRNNARVSDVILTPIPPLRPYAFYYCDLFPDFLLLMYVFEYTLLYLQLNMKNRWHKP